MLRSVRRKDPIVAETQHSVRTVKTFLYKGDPVKEWSNRYYFNGGAPTDTAAWHALMDGVAAAERPCYREYVTLKECFGYAPGSGVSVASKTMNQVGTLGSANTVATPGDCAAVLRQATTKRSTKNHPVYVFSYFHAVMFSSTIGDHDLVLAAQKAAIEALGTVWLNGLTVGARVYKRTTPSGELVTGAACDTWISHRDFPR